MVKSLKRISKNNYYFFWFIMLISCQPIEYENIPYYRSYFPLELNSEKEFLITRIIHNSFGKDTNSYFLKEVVTEKFIDLEGDTVYRIERYSKVDSNASYIIKDVWTSKLNYNNALLTEENEIFTKLIFPLNSNVFWNGNAYKTKYGLTKAGLVMNKNGRIVSEDKHKSAKKEMRLKQYGYSAKKGKFGYVKKVSRVYFTKPFGLTTQKYFHNAAFLFLTNLFFNDLFIKMNALEKLIKKNKILENGPRRIDLDLIQFENLKVKNHLISIPHSSSHLRDFVIQPVLDLNPNFIDLKTQYTYKRLINNLDERFIIKKSRQNQDYQEGDG